VTRAAAEPQLPVAARMWMDPVATDGIVKRQLGWAAVQGVGALLAATALAAFPDLGFGLALGLGAAVAYPRRATRGLPVALGVIAITLLAGIPGDGSSTLSTWVTPGLAAGFTARGLGGAQILAAGAAAGVGLGWVAGPKEPARFAQMALAGAAAAGLGAWAAGQIVPGTFHPALATVSRGVIAGFVASQVLTVGALRFKQVTRPPSPRRVKATLQARYTSPCLRAWELDRDLANRSPDDETRDGLGEVAAWVYRLQWTLQRLDQELESDGLTRLVERIAVLAEEADRTTDAFTRDRKLATLRHLERLHAHAGALAEERSRTEALSQYAGAYLEEARAGLALAHLTPGDHTPDGLNDVLSRLRTHEEEAAAHRRTAREVSAVSA
jgi:hypothetical protein